MDFELHANWLNRVLQFNDLLVKNSTGEDIYFQSHPLTWYGRLANPGVVPGLYRDRYHVVVKNGDRIEELSIKDIEFKDSSVSSLRTSALPENWHELNFEADCQLPKLPPTLFLEGDIVHLVDIEHPKFTSSRDLIDPDTGENKGPIPLQQLNQYTIYRINYRESFTWNSKTNAVEGKNPIYRLRAGKIQFDAHEDQLQLLSRGPVKIYYSSENFELPWRSLKDEAEFYLLLGRFSRQYNKEKNSYLWELAEARTAIFNHQGDAVLKNSEGHWLVKFWDRSIGEQVIERYPLILDI